MSLNSDSLAISRQLRCPVCEGQTLESSEALIAQQMKATITQQLAQGKTTDEVLDFMALHYGQEILVNPSLKSHPFLWGAPLLMCLIVGAILCQKIRRPK
jgi:cytochrome c-type biogenesis protein CcmH